MSTINTINNINTIVKQCSNCDEGVIIHVKKSYPGKYWCGKLECKDKILNDLNIIKEVMK